MHCSIRLAFQAVCVALALVSSTVAADDESGFEALFDGKSLDGWDGDPKFWSVADGAIVGQTTKDNPTKGNTFLVWKKGEISDFELRLTYRIRGGNSGIQYRSKEVEKWTVGGYQADFEADKKFSGILYDERGIAGNRGIMAERGQKVAFGEDGKKKVVGSLGKSDEIQAVIKNEDWNEYRIVAKGNHLQHFINGRQTIDVVDEDAKKRRDSGILALQLHAGPPMKVEFKNIRYKKL